MQLVALGVTSGGAIFLLPLALAEINGWVMLTLWLGLNFLGLPLIVWLTDKILSVFKLPTIIIRLQYLLLTGITGGLLSYILYLTYYKFHMHSIQQEFSFSKFQEDFLPIVTTMTITIAIGELIRKFKKTAANYG